MLDARRRFPLAGLLTLFFEIHGDLPREAPGDDESTRRALALLTGLPPRPKIVDAGCGPGTPTLVLAAQTGGCIAGVDTHRPYLDRLTVGCRNGSTACASAIRRMPTRFMS